MSSEDDATASQGGEEGKSKKLTKRLLTIDCADKLDCLQLLRAFTRATRHLRCQYFWQLPSDTGRWLATSIDDMLQRVLKRLAPRHQPPPGCKWTSHSLRAGAASAAYAVCKDFLKLCLYGGWARGSDVMQDAYIDPSWRSTDAARYFFGWLRDAAG
ncbi:Core-binding (CB) domain-containing protein [Pycnococcus provasolii]